MGKHKGMPGHLFSTYFEEITGDDRLLPSHIGLVMALFYYHDPSSPLNFFHASRSKLMRFSRIKSVTTYHKCLSELVACGYLEYIPSWHPVNASRFRFIFDDRGDGNG